MPLISDHRLIAQASVALVRANLRYWRGVAPLVHAQLDHWQRRANAIPDHTLRAIALQKLREEHFTAEAAATLATLAPPTRRSEVVRAIVALEVMYDYLDGLTEQPTGDPLRNGATLFRAFEAAVARDSDALSEDYYTFHETSNDGGYLDELVAATRSALAGLPASGAVGHVLEEVAARGAGAQVRAHAVPVAGRAQLEAWAMHEAAAAGVPWREFLAGAASSVAAVHAVVALASNEMTTSTQALVTANAYLSIAALATMIDSVVDYETDFEAGKLALGYLQYYRNRSLAQELSDTARRAVAAIRRTDSAPHHLMTLVGVVAYYTSEPGGKRQFARSVVRQLHRELTPLLRPTLALMRGWRIAKRAQLWRRRRVLDPDCACGANHTDKSVGSYPGWRTLIARAGERGSLSVAVASIGSNPDLRPRVAEAPATPANCGAHLRAARRLTYP